MKCPNCSYHNNENGLFCQECGYEFNKNKKTRLDSVLTENKPNEASIDDVIFRPKKQTGAFESLIKFVIKVMILGFLGLVGLAAIGLLLPDDTSTSSTQEQQTTFPISSLNIENYEIEYIEDEAFFTGTLKNHNSRDARNVNVRIDFYKEENQSKHFDTRRVTIDYGADAYGAFSFQVPLYIYPEGEFWWVWKIESAEYGL